jgi:hypothetical protein
MTEAQEPDYEALLNELRAQRKVTREMIRRAKERPGPGITDQDIEAEFERVRRAISRGRRSRGRAWPSSMSRSSSIPAS